MAMGSIQHPGLHGVGMSIDDGCGYWMKIDPAGVALRPVWRLDHVQSWSCMHGDLILKSEDWRGAGALPIKPKERISDSE